MAKVIRLLALLVIILGAASLYTGISKRKEFPSKVKKTVLGNYPKETHWYIYGGIALIVVSVAVLGVSFFYRKKH